MNRISILACVLCGATAMSIAQTTPQGSAPGATPPSPAPSASETAKPQADNSNAAQPKGPAIPATLEKSVDSKKVKAGDPIEAKTSVGMSSATGVQIPEGSRILGHITDAKAKSKGDPQSSLAFSFEKIVLKNGQELPFHAVAQAIGLAQSPASAAFPESGGPNAQAASTGMQGGASPAVGSSAGGSAGASSATPHGVANVGNSGGALPEGATGVVGIKGLTLDSQANSSVISSDSKSVKLDSGIQMLLKIIPQ